MKRFLAAVALFSAAVLSLPAVAADKGGMPAKVDALGNVKSAFSGCHLGASAGGAFVSDALGSFNGSLAGVEAGCDLTRSSVVFGFRGGYDFGEDSVRFARVGGRIGYLLNAHSLAYATIEIMMDGRNVKVDNSILALGVGLEIQAFGVGNFIFTEAAKDVKTFGDAGDITDAWTFRAGFRRRF